MDKFNQAVYRILKHNLKANSNNNDKSNLLAAEFM